MEDLSFLDEYDKAKANDLKFLDDYDKIKNPSLSKDLGNLALQGLSNVAGAAGYGLEKTIAPDLGRKLQDFDAANVAKLQSQLSPAQQKAGAEPLLNPNYQPGTEGGSSFLNPNFGLRSLAANVIPSIPGTVAMALPGMPLARAATGAAKLLGAGKYASTIGSGLGYGASEGAFSGAQNAAQFGQEQRAKPIEAFQQSPEFQTALADLGDPEKAKESVIQKGQNDIFNETLLKTGGISALTGGGVFGALERPAKTFVGGLAKGVVSEAAQEAPQSFYEQVAQNKATQKYVDPSQDIYEGAKEAAAIGGLSGGIMGLAGGAGPLTRAANKVITPAQTTGEENVQPELSRTEKSGETFAGNGLINNATRTTNAGLEGSSNKRSKFTQEQFDAAHEQNQGQNIPGQPEEVSPIIASEDGQSKNEFSTTGNRAAFGESRQGFGNVNDGNNSDQRNNLDGLHRGFKDLDGAEALQKEQGYLAGSNDNGANKLSLLRKRSNLADNIEANPITDYITSRQKALEAGLFDDEQSNIVKNRIAILSAIDPEQTDDAAKALNKSLEVESKYNIFVPETQKEPAIKADILPTQEKTDETIQNASDAYERNANEEARKGQEEALLTPTHRLYDGTLVRQEEDGFTTLDGKDSYSKDEQVEALTEEEIQSYKESPVTQDATPKAKPELNDGQLFEPNALDEKEKAKAQDSGIASGEQLLTSDTRENGVPVLDEQAELKNENPFTGTKPEEEDKWFGTEINLFAKDAKAVSRGLVKEGKATVHNVKNNGDVLEVKFPGDDFTTRVSLSNTYNAKILNDENTRERDNFNGAGIRNNEIGNKEADAEKQGVTKTSLGTKEDFKAEQSSKPELGKFENPDKAFIATAQGQKYLYSRGARVGLLQQLNDKAGKPYSRNDLYNINDSNIDVVQEYLTKKYNEFIKANNTAKTQQQETSEDIGLAKEPEQPYTLNSGRNEFSKKEVDILFNDPKKPNVSRETYQAKETFDGSGKYNLLPIKQDDSSLAPERKNDLPSSQKTRDEGASSSTQELPELGLSQAQSVAKDAKVSTPESQDTGTRLPQETAAVTNSNNLEQSGLVEKPDTGRDRAVEQQPILNKTTNQPFKTKALAQKALASKAYPEVTGETHEVIDSGNGFVLSMKPEVREKFANERNARIDLLKSKAQGDIESGRSINDFSSVTVLNNMVKYDKTSPYYKKLDLLKKDLTESGYGENGQLPKLYNEVLSKNKKEEQLSVTPENNKSKIPRLAENPNDLYKKVKELTKIGIVDRDTGRIVYPSAFDVGSGNRYRITDNGLEKIGNDGFTVTPASKKETEDFHDSLERDMIQVETMSPYGGSGNAAEKKSKTLNELHRAGGLSFKSIESYRSKPFAKSPQNPVIPETKQQDTVAKTQSNILTTPKSAWVKQQVKAQGLKVSSPGFNEAKKRIESQFEKELVSLPVNDYLNHPEVVKDTAPESLKIQDYESKRSELGLDKSVKFSKSESPQFYSQLRRSFESAPDKVFATGKQAKAWMQSNAPKHGVKSDEIYWSGVEDYLDANPKASKQDVLKYLDENGVKTEDKVLGKEVTLNDLDSISKKRYDIPFEQLSMSNQRDLIEEFDSKSAKHNNEKLTLPGGTNYQETVVTIPTTEKFNESDTTHFGDTGQGKQIAWMRHNDRTDVNGNKVLFLEEIQSQRGQEGRKYGFWNIRQRNAIDSKLKTEYGVDVDDNTSSRQLLDKGIPEDVVTEWRDSRFNNNEIPPAPFVTDSNNKATNAYISLLMKKAVMKAVENGQDHVSWTTGMQQQDRYNLSKQLDRIEYWAMPDNTYGFSAFKKGNDGVPDIKKNFLSENELAENIGKDLAQKIVNREHPTTKVGDTQYGEINGVNLRTGGEWTQSMYGNEQGLDAKGAPSLITKAAKDIAKKFGGQIGTIKLDTGNQPALIITPEMKAKILGEGVPLFSKDNENYKVKPPKILYRGTNKTNEFRGATLGKGIYTTRDKKFASKFGDIKEILPQDAWPRNPLVLPNAYSGAADALNDWVIQNTEYKNIRDFNKKYSDPSVFLKEKGYDGVIAGDEVVYYGSNILTSKKHKPTGSTKEQVHSWLDAKDKEHVKSGKLNIAETKADIPKGLVSVDANGVEGFYDPKGKKVWVVAENVNKDTVRSVLNHEYLHASLNENPRLNERLMKAHSDMRTLFNDVEKGAYTGKYKEVYDAALRRVDRAKTRQEDRYEEFLAYAITEHSKSPRSLPEKIAKAVQNIIASIKSAIFKYSGYIGKISPADLTALARSSMSSKGMLDNSGKDNPLASINAWHGSPHDHNKFDSANIGTGEGAQAYGYGHYFTDKKDIAEYYKNSITKNDDITITGKFDKSFFDDFDSPINDVKSSISNLFRNEASKPGYLKEIADNESYLGRLASGILNKTIIKNQGRIYQVELAPNENELLDWDKPLNYQSDKIKSFIEKIGYLTPWDGNENKITGWKIAPDISSRSVDILNPKGERVRTLQNTKVPGNLFEKVLVKEAKEIADKMFNPNGMSLGRDIYNLFSKTKGGDKKASDYLHSIGIRGIKYKADAGQSDAYNYVIFSDDDINITNKYSIKDDVKDFLTQSSNVISLADMDTVLKTGKMPRTQYDYQQFKDKAATLLVDSTRPFDVDMRKFPNVNDVAKVINAKDLAKGKTSALEKEAMRDFVQPLAEKIKALTKTTGFEFRAVQQIIGEWMSARYAIEKNGDYIRQDQKAVDDAQEALDVDPTNSQLKSALTKAKTNQQKRLDAINEQKWIDAKEEGLSAKLAGGYNNFTAQEQMRKYEAIIPKKDLESAAQHIYDLMKWKVDLDLKTGKVTQAQVDKWFKSPYYVPLTGDPSVDNSEDELFQHGGVNQSGDKAAKGRQKSKAQSGIDAAIEQVQKSTRYAGWNDFKDSLNNLYNNLIQEELDNGATMREAIINVKDQYNIVKKPISNDAMLPSTAITYRKNGKNYYFDLGNQAAIDALKSINKEQIPSILQPVANFTRLSARLVTTMLPSFAQVNAIRDVWERSENIRTRVLNDYPNIDMNKVGKDAVNIAFNSLSPTNNLVKKIASVMLEGTKGGEYLTVDNNDPDIKLIKEMLEIGAGSTWGDYFESTNKTLANQLQKSTKLTSKTIEYLNAYNNSFELISSFAVYKALKQNGVTDKNTAGAATLNLMNFNKSGTATGPLRALYMFVNPALQGAQQMGLTLSTKQGKARAAAYLIGGMALYTALRAMGGDDDDLGVNKMDSQSSFITERNISIPIGNDEFIKVPVGFGMPQLMWSTATNLVKAMAGSQDGADTAAEIIKSFMRVVAPVAPSETAITDHPIFWMAQSATPQIAKPLMNVGLGINAFGQPLTNSKFENPSVSRALQGRKSTPEEYKEMAQVLGRMGIKMYPEEVRELVNGYGLGPIREYVIKPLIENPNKEKLGRKTISTTVDRWVSAYDKSGLKERLYYRMVDEANDASIKKSLGSELSPREQKLANLNDVVTKLNRKASGKLAAATKAEKAKKNGAKYRREGEQIKDNAMNIMINGYKSLPE